MGNAHADEPVVEWRVMGPAWSYHRTMNGARVVQPAPTYVECFDAEGAAIAPQQATPGDPQQTCVSWQGRAKRAWTDNNPALGIERTKRYADHSTKLFATLVRDSYGSASIAGGGGWFWPLLDRGGFTIDAGIAGGLWWRTVLSSDNETRLRRLLPYALPTLAFGDGAHTGLGFNLAFIPRICGHDVCFNRADTWMLQTTWRYR